MATWMTHFRIADCLLDRIDGLNAGEFIVGNIGPDCGEPNEDWSIFSPPTNITHWRSESNESHFDDFYAAYLNPGTVCQKRRSFYLGYYVHLLTDDEWAKLIYYPKKAIYQAEFEKDGKFIWKFKRDWYDNDHLFHQANPDFRAFSIFSKIHCFNNDYLDYFSQQAFQKKIDYITSFYLNHQGDLTHDYPYLNANEMDAFVRKASETIIAALDEKNKT